MPTMPTFAPLPEFTIAPRQEIFAGIHPAQQAPCWSPPRDGVAIVGPPGYGKTAGVFIPQMLWWDGPVISTSTRGDVLHATGDYRRRLAEPGGDVYVFDPFKSEPGVTSLAWSPLDGCADPDVTFRRVAEMTTAASHGIQDSQHWARGAARILRPLMHAAALANKPLATLLEWLDTHHIDTPAAILAESDSPAAHWHHQLEATQHLSDRERSSFYSVASNCFDAYASPTVLAAADTGPRFDIDAFLATKSSLYIIGPPHYQAALAPIIVGLIAAIVQRGLELAAEAGGVLQPRLLCALDELPNIAPLPTDLVMGLVSAGGGSGITTSWGAQTLAHLRDRYGDTATDAIVGACGTKLIFGGLSPGSDLADISSWAGEHRETSVTVHAGPATPQGAAPTTGIGDTYSTDRSHAVSSLYRPVLPPEAIRQTQPGHAWLWHGSDPPVLVDTRPAGLVPAYAAVAGYTPHTEPFTE